MGFGREVPIEGDANDLKGSLLRLLGKNRWDRGLYLFVPQAFEMGTTGTTMLHIQLSGWVPANHSLLIRSNGLS